MVRVWLVGTVQQVSNQEKWQWVHESMLVFVGLLVFVVDYALKVKIIFHISGIECVNGLIWAMNVFREGLKHKGHKGFFEHKGHKKFKREGNLIGSDLRNRESNKE